MSHHMRLSALAVAASITLPVLASTPESEEPLSYPEAEQFVHGNLYDAMINVWAVDRRSWNQLLHVHACGGELQAEKISESYKSAQPLFSKAMSLLAEQHDLFTQEKEQAILNDVSQMAYRLFSSTYAHGYARHIAYLEELSPGIQAEMCGSEDPMAPQGVVDYPDAPAWQVSMMVDKKQDFEKKSFEDISNHASRGYKAFNKVLSEQYERFDALVYSHAYQYQQAYDQLFFDVNRFENVAAYQKLVDAEVVISEQETGHADFAYLVLSSGYHWGTLSVLAMLEEEYPRLHEQAKSNATQTIQQVTTQLSISPSDSIGR